MTEAERVEAVLHSVAPIIEHYENKKRENEKLWDAGEKYNIFKVAGIADKEVRMCRVLADLLNPKGQHRRGSVYLNLFWEAIKGKLPDLPALNLGRAKVETEYHTDEGGRIDIVIEDGNVFAAIEVKIWARDQDRQVADYFEFAQSQNKAARIPVFYLTLDGHEPSEDSREGIGKDDYVRLSFKDDILPWLENCLKEPDEEAVRVRENLKQFSEAIKSLCRQSEDAKMDAEIVGVLKKDAASVKTAFEIEKAASAIARSTRRLRKALVEENVLVPLEEWAGKQGLDFERADRKTGDDHKFITNQGFRFDFKRRGWKATSIVFRFEGQEDSFGGLKCLKYGIWSESADLKVRLASAASQQGAEQTPRMAFKKEFEIPMWNDDVLVKLASGDDELVLKIEGCVESMLHMLDEEAQGAAL